MEGQRPSVSNGIIGRWKTAWASRNSVKTFTIAAFFAVAFSLFILSGRQRNLGGSGSCDFPAVFNFGDSNSDTAEKLGLPHLSAYLDSIDTNFRHGANFATGGSTIQRLDARMFKIGYSPISLDIQLSQFEQFKERINELYKEGVSSNIKSKLPRPEDFSQALYTVDIGQNDLDCALKSMTEKQAIESVPGIINQFAQAVKRLHNQGARTFWIHNTGPIGCLPFEVLDYPQQHENVDQNGCLRSLNEIAHEFNRQLKDSVIQLRMQFPDAALTYVDIYLAKYSLISDAKHHGFVNPLGYCCGHHRDNLCWRKKTSNGTEISATPCSNPSAYISWDGIHYSHAANLWVANKVLDGLVSDPPTPITEACHRSLNL
ncbi:hypothetical protein F383_26287 [Gossypium arboreum]|uniref:GDSL esterase/lipase At5g14450-like n=1 Tax=Gossypium arboreum TaxID=29729 RepID=A0A0B0MP07_GOSAR|nr:hypothetical protein F383_26287 [Gossypium arboreum]